MASCSSKESTETKTKKTIVLRSLDGEEFQVEEAVADMSRTIHRMIEDDDCAAGDVMVPLPNVSSKILPKVIEYCKNHVEFVADDEAKTIRDWDAGYLKEVSADVAILFQLIQAASYLDIAGLMDLTCQAVADMIKDKEVEEIREMFNIENDYTPEEEEAVRKENAWAFE